MKRIYKRTFALVTLGLFAITLFPSIAKADDPKARAIMEKVDARDDGDNMTSNMTMTLIDRRGKERIRQIRSMSKDFGEDSYRLMFFVDPPDVRNTGFLTYDYDDPNKDDDQWLYLPALKKTKRIASSDKSGSFMGSDFYYADMIKRDLNEYDFKLLKEDAVRGHKVWVIESVPRTKEVAEEYGYTKSVVFVRQDNYVVVRGVNWVKKGKKLKYMDVKKVEEIDGVWVNTEMHMITKKGKKTEHKTVMTFTNVKLNQELSDDLFSIRRLEKGL